MQSLSFLLALVCALVLGLVSADPLGAGVPSISSSLSRRANEQRDSDKDNLLATTAAYDAWKARFQTDFEKGSTYVYKAGTPESPSFERPWVPFEPLLTKSQS